MIHPRLSSNLQCLVMVNERACNSHPCARIVVGETTYPIRDQPVAIVQRWRLEGRQIEHHRIPLHPGRELIMAVETLNSPITHAYIDTLCGGSIGYHSVRLGQATLIIVKFATCHISYRKVTDVDRRQIAA